MQAMSMLCRLPSEKQPAKHGSTGQKNFDQPSDINSSSAGCLVFPSFKLTGDLEDEKIIVFERPLNNLR
jgi:hypothetical protein